MRPPSPDRNNVCAVIVTFHPDSDFPNRARIVACQVGGVVIVDNGSDELAVAMLNRFTDETGSAFLPNSRNLGVATALNQGLKWVREHGFVWLLTMDQDTILMESAIPVYAQAVESLDDINVAIVGANFRDKLTGVPLMPEDAFGGGCAIQCKGVITSGSLVLLEAAQAIGEFRDDYFVDYLDAEYCLRANKLGYSILITREPLIEHTIGDPRWHSLLGRRLITPHLPSERRYYMSRNHIVLTREYWREERQWLVQLARTRLKETILILLFEQRKAIKLWNTLRGVVDGLLGRMGPL